MRKLIILVSSALFPLAVLAQLDLPPSGNNPRATLAEVVGITSITIDYSRPDVAGREGKIWGDSNVITYGFSTQNFITNKNTSPWRAGANENTTISFEHDVKVEGRPLKAGKYGLFMAVWPDSATIIFSNATEAWGSFYYEEKNDALRVNVKTVKLEKSVEYLKYEFIEHKEKSCTIALMWEKMMIPFKVDVDVDNIVIARLREQVTGQKGFNALMMNSAANYLLTRNLNLEEALEWSQRAANLKTFATLNTLGTAYTKLKRLNEADSTMKEALVFASPAQYMGYGRALISQKRLDKALEIFNMNLLKNGDIYAVNAGFTFYYSAKADFKKALEYASKALAQAPNDAVKTAVQANIKKLKEGKDINQ